MQKMAKTKGDRFTFTKEEIGKGKLNAKGEKAKKELNDSLKNKAKKK